ncbi:hypothetical protein C8F01DRAFT_1085758 [Mycena amicta]|nr:hypothetical protein C8F01DRAFT_1085758 [Mycena amicta]
MQRKCIRAAQRQRQQRHRHKLAGGVLGQVSPLPALLVEHASFELPVDKPGFLDGYSADYNFQDPRFASWSRFPIFPPLPPTTRIPLKAPSIVRRHAFWRRSSMGITTGWSKKANGSRGK